MSDFEVKNLEVYEIPRIIRVQTYKDIVEGRLETVQVEMFFQDVLVPIANGLNGDAISKGEWQSIVLESTDKLLLHMQGLAEEGYRQILARETSPPEEIL